MYKSIKLVIDFKYLSSFISSSEKDFKTKKVWLDPPATVFTKCGSLITTTRSELIPPRVLLNPFFSTDQEHGLCPPNNKIGLMAPMSSHQGIWYYTPCVHKLFCGDVPHALDYNST